MKSTFAILSIIIGYELLILVYKIFAKKIYYQPLGLMLGILALFNAPWTVCYGLMYLFSSKEIAIITYRIGSIGWTIGISFWILFFYELYYYIANKKRKILIHAIFLLVGVFFWILALSGLIYANDLELSAWWGWREIVDSKSTWVSLFGLFILAALIISIVQVLRTIKFARFNKQLKQLKLISYALLFAVIPTAIINIIFPLYEINSIPPLGHLFITPTVLTLGYIIIKYRMLEITPTYAAAHLLFEASDYVFLSDLNGFIQKISNSASAILSFNEADLNKKNISDFTSNLDIAGLQLKTGGNSIILKTDLIADNSTVVPVRCKVTLVADEFNDPIGYLFIMTDLRDMIAIEDLEKEIEDRTSELEVKNKLLSEEIAEKKKIEDQLRLFANTIKSISENICITDLDDNVLFVNRSFCSAYGYSQDEILGKKASLFLSAKNDPDLEDEIFPETLNGGWEGELWNKRKDGTEFQIFLSTSVINNDSGHPVALVGISSDITKQKQIEQTLRENEAKHRILLDESTDPIFSFSSERRYLYVNPAFAEGVNKSVDEILGKTIWDVFGKEEADKRVVALDYVFKTGEEKIIEVKVPRSDGDRYYITSITPIKNEKGLVNVVICSSKDITQRKKGEEEQAKLLEELRSSRVWIEQEAIQLAILNEQLEESETKLKELNASKDKFFSIIAHDLKSPFLSLLGYCEILTNEFDMLSDDEKKESIAGIYELSNNSYKLLDNLLQWARIQIGKAEFNPELFNLLYELSPAILLYSQTAKNKNITIENHIDRKTFIIADRNMLNTIVRNLISNSIKFCNRGGQIIISSIESADYVEIMVQDNGVGMDENQMNNLFSIDKNMSTKGTANERGTGLGLLLSKEMIDKHGGKIWAHSEPGKGCEFKFTIPKF